VSAGRLNVLSLGEPTARSLGLRVQRLKLVLLSAVVVATGAAVAVSGAIAFIGLLVPHGVRLLWGQDARWFVPLSALGGALFLVAADSVVRLAFSPFEVPVGIVTALLGAPFFLMLLARRKD
jgi:iron complex transport system permease protein